MSENVKYLVDVDDSPHYNRRIAERKSLKRKIVKAKGRRKNNWERESRRNGRI